MLLFSELLSQNAHLLLSALAPQKEDLPDSEDPEDLWELLPETVEAGPQKEDLPDSVDPEDLRELLPETVGAELQKEDLSGSEDPALAAHLWPRRQDQEKAAFPALTWTWNDKGFWIHAAPGHPHRIIAIKLPE